MSKKQASTSKRLGRSSVTGKYVLAPASKEGKVSLSDARKVMREVLYGESSGARKGK